MDIAGITAPAPGEVGLVTWRDYVCDTPFVFASGEEIPGFTLRYETYGRLNEARDNAILICHALSGDHHCAGVHRLEDRKPGWWNNMIGPHKPIDTTRYFVICSNSLGGCQGSTGPASLDPRTGKPYHLDFPLVTIEDMVAAQHRLLTEELGLEQLHAVVGGSMGGMQVLAWGIHYAAFVGKLVALATTARQSTQAIAFNEVGRSAIMQDADWRGGSYVNGKGPGVGLAIARMMAHITYLSDEGLEEKFGRSLQNPGEARAMFDAEFAVESYLRHQGRSFINRFDANTYLYFTKALDRFDLYGPEGRLDETFGPVLARTLVVGFTSDWLYPPQQNRDLVLALLKAGKEATYAELKMSLGHDSFLVDAPDLYELMEAFLDG